MSGYVDLYHLAQPASFHPRLFDVAASNASRKYGGNFAKGFGTRIVTLEQMAEEICRNVWSPIVFLGGARDSDNFVESAWMALDFETPEYCLKQALSEWSDSVHIIGVTRNHQKAKNGEEPVDRFRLVVPWVEPITDVHVYRHAMSGLVDRYGADNLCKDGARLFYPCAEIVSINRSGYLQPFDRSPPRQDLDAPKVFRELGIVRRRTLLALKHEFPNYKKNDLCFQCAKDLFDAGYDSSSIYKIIVSSPTYSGKVSPDLEEEIRDCIRSGIKSVKQGKAHGGCNGHGAGKSEAGKEDQEGAEEIGAVLSDHSEDEPQSAGA